MYKIEKRGISPDHQRLIFMSRELRDKETLEESGVCVVDKGSRFSPRSFTSSSIISVLRVIMVLILFLFLTLSLSLFSFLSI